MTKWNRAKPFTGYIQRERLVHRLGYTRLSVIAGQAGAGKTALLNEYLATQLNTPIYVRASGRSPDAIWFEVANEAAALGLLQPPSAASNTSGRLRELGDIPAGTIVAIDGVGDARALESGLRALLSGSDLRFILITRDTSAFEDLLVEEEGEYIGPSDLRLNASEIEDALREAGLQADTAWEQTLYPLQFRVLLLLASQGVLGQASPRELVGAKLLKLLLPAESADQLSALALPDTLDARLIRALVGRADGEHMFRLGEQRGLGQRYQSSRGLGFVIHEEYRTALRNLFNEKPASARRRLWTEFALYSVAEKRTVEALRGAVEAEDYYLASRVVRDNFEALGRLYQDDARQILSTVSANSRARFPSLALAHALSLYSAGRHARAAIQLLAVANGLRRRTDADDPVEYLFILAMQSAAYRLAGRYQAASNVALRALPILRDLGSMANDVSDGFSRALPHFAISLLYAGKFAEALNTLLIIDVVLPPTSAGSYHATSLLAGVYAIRGDLPSSQKKLDLLRRAREFTFHAGSYIDYAARAAAALLAIERGEVAQAQAILQSVEKHFSTIEHWPYMLTIQSYLRLLQNEPQLGLQEISAARAVGAHPRTSNSAEHAIDRAEALLYLAAGDWKHIPGALRKLGKLPADDALRGLSHLLSRRYEEVIVGLSSHRNRTDISPMDAGSILTLSACAAHGAGREAVARGLAFEASAVLRAHELTFCLVRLPEAERTWFSSVTGVFAPLAHTDLFASRERRTGSLSRRERQVLSAMAAGMTRDEIANHLHVSSNTVKSQLRSIYKKLEVNSGSEAVLVAGELALLDEVPTKDDPVDGDA